MQPTTTVKVSKRYQIALPSQARQRMSIERGDRLLVDIQDGMMILMPQPDDYATNMAGLHSEVWQGMNSTEYLQQERQAWKASDND